MKLGKFILLQYIDFCVLGCQVDKKPCHKGFATFLRLSEVVRGCQGLTYWSTHWQMSVWQRFLSVLGRLQNSLQGLNSFEGRLLVIVRSLLMVEFSRELNGLQALKQKFAGCKALNFREN